MSAPLEVVRHARARRMKLSVDPRTGVARLTLPPRASLARALAWAEGQRGWIASQQQRLPQAVPFVPGADVPFGDEQLEIVWRPDAPRTARREGTRLVCGGPHERVGPRVEAWLKREALRLLSAETAEFAARAGVKVEKVGIGDPRSRWGSCTASGAIRYSWRLVLAPSSVRRATVAHEVAHRVHMNHGPDFHALVERLYGADPTPARAWLKANGAALHWIGRYS